VQLRAQRPAPRKAPLQRQVGPRRGRVSLRHDGCRVPRAPLRHGGVHRSRTQLVAVLAVAAAVTAARGAWAAAPDDELVRRAVILLSFTSATVPGRQDALDATFRDNGFTGAPAVWPITGFGIDLVYYRFRFALDAGWGPSHTLRRWADGATASYSRRLA